MTKKFAKRYEDFCSVSGRALEATDTAPAPGTSSMPRNRRYRDLTTGEILAQAFAQALERTSGARRPPRRRQAAPKAPRKLSVLDRVDLEASLTTRTTTATSSKYQRRLGELTWKARQHGINTVAVFEGWDAAGKGGAIRRLTAGMDARQYRTISIGAPSDEELAHHYLWRFWRHVPRAGYVTIYDRSWYGRVLVERVEAFAREDEWRRAYGRSTTSRSSWSSHGVVLLKFWFHISPDEQLRRFKEREATPWKQYKITDEDWRNRKKWDAYVDAVDDMVAHTSTEAAPWHLSPETTRSTRASRCSRRSASACARRFSCGASLEGKRRCTEFDAHRSEHNEDRSHSAGGATRVLGARAARDLCFSRDGRSRRCAAIRRSDKEERPCDEPSRRSASR